MALLAERLRRQRLTGEPFPDSLAAVSWFGAVQSQDFAAALWGIGQRCADTNDASIRRLFDHGAILRTHVLRPTWHFVAPADLRWMLALTAPRVHVKNGPYYRRHDLDDKQLHRAADVITAALAGTQLTRTELAAELARKGIDTEGLRLTLIVMWCELEALICSGAMRGRQHTYALVDERVAEAPERETDDALGELATRYFASHGPATLTDFVWWSGLKVSEARRAVDIAQPPEHVRKSEQLSEREPTGEHTVHLLPNFDEYVIAYQDRSALLPLAKQESVPLDSHLLLIDGRMAGTWKRTLNTRHVTVSVQLPTSSDRVSPDIRDALARQVGRLGTFLDHPAGMAGAAVD
jgi:hypothetical protein